MKKQSFFLLLMILSALASQAQKGNNQLQIFAETGFSNDAKKPGIGGGIKGDYGIGKAGQLTLSAALIKFHSNKLPDARQSTTRLIPVLVGYRYNINKFYLEPQAGIAELGGKIDMNGDYARPSVAAFTYAIGIGVNYRRFDFGIRYVSAKGIEGASAGTWNNRELHYTGLHAGYILCR